MSRDDRDMKRLEREAIEIIETLKNRAQASRKPAKTAALITHIGNIIHAAEEAQSVGVSRLLTLKEKGKK